jgi:hypothetical protein
VELAWGDAENPQNILAAIAGHDWVVPLEAGIA